MIGAIFLLFGTLLPPAEKATLRIEGRLQGIELIIQPGESTYALGALPRAYPAKGELVYDFGDLSSSLPPLTSIRVRLYLSPDVRNLSLDLYAEFSNIKINLEHIDTLKVNLNSRFSSFSVYTERAKVYLLNISQLRGTSAVSGKRAEDYGDITIMGGTFKISGYANKIDYLFNAEGSEIVSTNKVTLHRTGLLNRLRVEDKSIEFTNPRGILKVYGNFNIIKFSKVDEE